MVHTVHNDFLTVSVAEDGAQLQSVLGRDGTEYLWQGDPAYWPDRALNLFPYVARLTEQRRDALALELAAAQETMAQYPRDFRFCIHYVLWGSAPEAVYTGSVHNIREICGLPSI